MITLKNLEKIYRTKEIETVALENVNLTVNKGEFLSIMHLGFGNGSPDELDKYIVKGVVGDVKRFDYLRPQGVFYSAQHLPDGEIAVRSNASISDKQFFQSFKPAMWDDVDLRDGHISIAHCITCADGRIVEKGPKTSAGYREIPLDPDLTSRLQARRELALEMTSTGHGMRGLYVLGKPTGGFYHPTFLTKDFRSFADTNGIYGVTGKLATYYSLRHTFATMLLRKGVDAKTVSSLMVYLTVECSAEDLAQRALVCCSNAYGDEGLDGIEEFARLAREDPLAVERVLGSARAYLSNLFFADDTVAAEQTMREVARLARLAIELAGAGRGTAARITQTIERARGLAL